MAKSTPATATCPGKRKRNRREIQDPHNAGRGQLFGNLLGRCRRDRQDGQPYPLLGHRLFQLSRMHFQRLNLPSHQLGIAVEGRLDAKSLLANPR